MYVMDSVSSVFTFVYMSAFSPSLDSFSCILIPLSFFLETCITLAAASCILIYEPVISLWRKNFSLGEKFRKFTLSTLKMYWNTYKISSI